MTRFFAAKASSRSCLVARGLSPRANPLRLSAERACPSNSDSDIPCRSHGATTGLPSPAAAHFDSPERVPPCSPNASTCRATQDWSPARRLELTASQPRMSSIGSILVSRRRVAVWSNSGMNPSSQLEHPCRPPELPACQGDGAPTRAGLFRSTEAATCAEATVTLPRQGISRQSLQPTRLSNEHP
jgi:hypothetical protein